MLKPTGTVVAPKSGKARTVKADTPKVSELRVIEDNVPVPKRTGGRRRNPYYVELESTLAKLRVDQSIRSSAAHSTVLHCVKRTKNATGFKFITRVIKDDEHTYTRIWRIA